MDSNGMPAHWFVSAKDYEDLVSVCGGANMKVFKTPDDLMIKLFQIKPRLSSALVYPYSFRFARNARRLAANGIPTVEVLGTFFVPARGLHAAVYRMLRGEVLRDLDLSRVLLGKVAEFVAKLHRLGIYFRSLHLGNIIALPSGELGLIDIADIRFKRRPLTNGERVRNLHHLFRREDNRSQFGHEGTSAFLGLYEAACPECHHLTPQLEEFGRHIEQELDQHK